MATTDTAGDRYFAADGNVYNADGTVAGSYHTDAAGNVDSVSTDEYGNGSVDTSAVDTNADGTFETVSTDPAGF